MEVLRDFIKKLSILQRRKLRPREAKGLAQDFTANFSSLAGKNPHMSMLGYNEFLLVLQGVFS